MLYMAHVATLYKLTFVRVYIHCILLSNLCSIWLVSRSYTRYFCSGTYLWHMVEQSMLYMARVTIIRHILVRVYIDWIWTRINHSIRLMSFIRWFTFSNQ